MSAFKCSGCGVVENTATSNYWWMVHEEKKPPLCSQCDPEIKKWHDKFERKTPEELGVVEGPDGFLYDPKDPILARLLAEGRKRYRLEMRSGVNGHHVEPLAAENDLKLLLGTWDTMKVMVHPGKTLVIFDVARGLTVKQCPE